MNKLYLHIGMGKTGTSAIQYFLYENRERLLKQNIHYPITEGYFIDKDNDVTSGNADVIINHILNEEYDEIFEYIELLLKDNNVLISSELLVYYFGKNIDLFYDIVEKFNATVILYIRKQDEFFNSLVNQWTKLKFLTNTDCLKDVHENYFYVMKIINNIDNEKLIVRPYDKTQFKDGNLIMDFLDCLGLVLDNSYILNKRQINTSLSPIAYKLKQEYNRHNENVLNKDFIKVLIEYSRQEKLEYKNVFVISKQEREDLLEVYNVFNDGVAIKFLQRVEGKLFNKTSNDDMYIDDKRLYTEIQIKEAFEFIKDNYKGYDLDIEELFLKAFNVKI